MARPKDPVLEEARRQRVARVAEEALAAGAWSRVTIADVARKAGISKGAVTYWFPTKERLFLEALARYHARYEHQMAEVLAVPDASIRERVERLLAIAFPDQQTVAAEIRFQMEIWSFAKEHPEVHAAVRDSYARFRAACKALVEMAVVEGAVSRPRSRDLYQFIHALIDGVSLHVALDPDIDIHSTRKRLLALIEDWLGC